ncbi:hypothetical protein PG995_011606 [Apiospora arundinis]
MRPGAPHLVMRPEPERRLYEPDYESDTDYSSSGRSSPSDNAPRRPKRNKAGSLFIDATIAQDDTKGKAARGIQMLADLGSKMEEKDIKSKSDGIPRPSSGRAMSSTHKVPYRRGIPPPPRPGMPPTWTGNAPSWMGNAPSWTRNAPPGRGMFPTRGPGVHPPGRGLPPTPGYGVPPPGRPIGGTWMANKVNTNSPWRHSLTRSRGTAEASSSHSAVTNNVSVPGEASGSEEVVQEESSSAQMQLIPPSPGRNSFQNTGTGSGDSAVPSETRQQVSKEGGHEPRDVKKGDEELDQALSDRLENEPLHPNNARSSTDIKTLPEGTGLTEALAGIADGYLGLDVLDHSHDVSRYIGYLLDTVQSLESRLYYKGARDLELNISTSKELPIKLPIEENKVPCSQVLHRVVCCVSWHSHSCLIYEDEPQYQAEASEEPRGLCGNIPVLDVGYYLQQHPDTLFIITKEYECGQATQAFRDTNLFSERKETMQITSTALNEALKRIADFEPYSHWSDKRGWLVGEMTAPYLFLFHHYQKLYDLVQQKSSYRPFVDPLLQFLERNYGEEYRSANSLFQRGFVTAYHSTKLYKPFEVIVIRSEDKKTLSAGVLKHLPAPASDEKKKRWELEGWSWHYNGREARRNAWIEDTDGFEVEEVPISTLRVYPLKYARPEDVEKLRETGRRYWNMRHQSLLCYTGWDENHDRYYTNDRFVVDVATFCVMYREDNARTVDKRLFTYDKWPQKIDSTEEMPPDCKLLLPNVIQGFHLGSKKWKELHVNDFLPQVDWNKNAFTQLVLDEKTKEMIRALVDVQKSRDSNMDDIIKGKGNGLILLLHGSPGTGKTLTAESVAEIAEKPLYRVTCGDIGTNAQEVEKYLQTVMYLGKKWDCVLLLDEADVFLEERTMADLARNSLVSVFLRILEYHEGILILTSNRVGTFDEAFKSRIQVAIHYDNLTKKSRKAIWQNFFDMLEGSGENANMPELEGRLDELAGEEMNGRQIRNALLTARQLAQHRSERLDWEHLNQVMKTSAAFNKYLKTVKGHTDDKWAREEGIR